MNLNYYFCASWEEIEYKQNNIWLHLCDVPHYQEYNVVMLTRFETKYGKLFNFYVDYTDGIKTVYRLYEQYMLDDEKDEKSFNFVVIVQQV